MTRTIDYYFSVNSPWAYLGNQELARIAKANKAVVRAKPISLATIFPKTGGLPLPKRSPERQAYRLVELKRWRDYRAVQLHLEPPYFPADEALASRAILAAEALGGDAFKLTQAIHRALWAEQRDIADAATLMDVAQRAGLDGLGIVAKARGKDLQARFEALTEEALQQGVFGSPWYVYDGEPFWGQDRLDFLERALARG